MVVLGYCVVMCGIILCVWLVFVSFVVICVMVFLGSMSVF